MATLVRNPDAERPRDEVGSPGLGVLDDENVSPWACRTISEVITCPGVPGAAARPPASRCTVSERHREAEIVQSCQHGDIEPDDELQDLDR
jgi:hypothetical protein